MTGENLAAVTVSSVICIYFIYALLRSARR
jgi:hypothetical protein